MDVGRDVACEGERGRIDVEGHRAVAFQRGLVDVDIEAAVAALEHRRGLDGETGDQRALAVRHMGEGLGETGDRSRGVETLVGVVVARYDVGGHVVGEAELRPLAGECQIIGHAFGRKLVSETESVVEDADAHGHRQARILAVGHGICALVVILSYVGIFAPHWLPSGVVRGHVAGGDDGVLAILRLLGRQAERGGLYDLAAVETYCIHGMPGSVGIHIEDYPAVGRGDALGERREGSKTESEKVDAFHTAK